MGVGIEKEIYPVYLMYNQQGRDKSHAHFTTNNL